MPWVKLDDDFHSHPKVIGAGLEAVGLFARSLSYCGAYLTDGFIPNETVNSMSGRQKKLADRLVSAGLWERTEGGFLIPDYLEYNPPRSEVLRLREERSKSGRKGAKARWGGQSPLFEAEGNSHSNSHSEPHGTSDSKRHSKGDGKTMARARAARPVPISSPPDPPKGEAAISRKKPRYTGCRMTRGTHGSGYVHDPLGIDKPPADWPHPAPTADQVKAALAQTNGADMIREDPERYVKTAGLTLEPDELEKVLALYVPDEDERIRLTDLAADLRGAAA